MRVEVERLALSVGPLQEPEQPVGIDPRHAYVVAYYVHKFREVGHGWSSSD
jgi:hypothetical protein